MSKLSKNAFDTNSSDLVFILSNEANEKIANGEKVINVTVGSLLDKNGKLASFKPVDDALKNNVNLLSKKYPTVDGGKEFANNVEHWVFDKNYDNLKAKYNFASIATLGGTGALFLGIRNYADDKQKVIIPSIGWGNYVAICQQSNKDFVKYNLFKNNKFDLEDMLNLAKRSIDECGRALILINDPCHNPSGYCLDKDEWKYIVESLNKLNELGEVVLLLDVAYFDYAPEEESRIYFETLAKLDVNFMTLVAFSASKTLGIYGLRCGTLICISKLIDDCNHFIIASKSTARAVWSVPNHYIINTFNEVMSDNENRLLIKQQLEEYRQLLDLRKDYLFNNLNIFGNDSLPFKHGFFITYKVDNAKQFAEELKKQNIYVLPLNNQYIRVAICSLLIK